MLLFSISRLQWLCFCSMEICEEVGNPIRPQVFQVTHRRPPSRIYTSCSYPDYLVVFEVVKEHRASNENAVELEERLPDVRHWDLHGKGERLD